MKDQALQPDTAARQRAIEQGQRLRRHNGLGPMSTMVQSNGHNGLVTFKRVPAAGSRSESKTGIDAIPDDADVADTRTREPDPAVSNT